MANIIITFPDELPEGRKNSFLKGIIDHLTVEASTRSPIGHTPEGHDLYRAEATEVAKQIINAVRKITKR